MSAPVPGRILLADDEAPVRDTLAALLHRRGFACTGVGSGAEALAQLHRQEFDALIADIQMPGNDGLALIEGLPPVAAGLPVILLTGHPTVETAARSVRLSVCAYLTKPVETEELVAILDQAIAEHRGFRAALSGRQRLHDWERELERILACRRVPGVLPGGPLDSYRRLTLRQVILVLADLERHATMPEPAGAIPEAARRVESEAILRHVVTVLHRTKQSFKSKDLAELRQELEQLLGPGAPDAAGRG